MNASVLHIEFSSSFIYNKRRKGVLIMAFKSEYWRPGEEQWRSGEYWRGAYCGYPEGYQHGSPCTRFWYDKEEGRYNFEVYMPGIDKKDISLDMWGENFCLWAKKEDYEYSGCYTFPHYVDPEKAHAWYENGVLKVYAPLKDWDKRKHFEIH